MPPPSVVVNCCVSVGILNILKRLLCIFVPLTCSHEVGDDDDKKINRQNVVSFSVTSVSLSKTRWNAGMDAGTALITAVDASSAVP